MKTVLSQLAGSSLMWMFVCGESCWLPNQAPAGGDEKAKAQVLTTYMAMYGITPNVSVKMYQALQ